eukprot:1145043-Pelagomonas_calceolata.AAC.7
MGVGRPCIVPHLEYQALLLGFAYTLGVVDPGLMRPWVSSADRPQPYLAMVTQDNEQRVLMGPPWVGLGMQPPCKQHHDMREGRCLVHTIGRSQHAASQQATPR